MAFVFERAPSEFGLNKIRSVMEKFNKKISPVQSWIVDVERNIAMFVLEGGSSRDKNITPSYWAILINEQVITYYAHEYSLFCDLKNKVEGVEYLVLLGAQPENKITPNDEVMSIIREAMEIYGYRSSSQWTTITEVRIRFIDDFREFQRRYDQGGMQ